MTPAQAKVMSDTPEFSLIPFNEIHHPTTTNYIIRGIIPREGLVVVYGPPKCGKSFWVMDMTLHVALNWKYRGRKVKTGNVVYVACEGVSGITARIEAFRQELLQEEVGHIPFYLISSALDLIKMHKKLGEDIISVTTDKPIHIIVIDTLNRSLSGDENSSQDMGNYIKAADYLREQFHCAVIIIHHCGYDATHARGHTSLPAAIDTQIAVTRDKETNAVVATLELMKDGEMGEQIRSKLKQVEIGVDDEGDPMTSCVIEPEEGIDHPKKDKPITGQRKIILDLLKKAIDDEGEYPPDNIQLKINVRVVKYETARQYCEKGIIADTQGAKRTAISRGLKELQESGIIKTWIDYLWVA